MTRRDGKTRVPGAARHGVLRCRRGTVADTELGRVPDRRCTTRAPRSRCTASRDIGRRAFIASLGGAAVVPLLSPLPLRAQQVVPVVGFLRSTPASFQNLVTVFRHGLKEAGFVEGQNVAIEYRYADNQPDRLPSLATDLIRRPVAAIVANTSAARAAKAATPAVPIVFVTGSDPIRDGLVTSLNRPGGNVTGVVFITSDLGAKRLELLKQLVPKATTVAMLVYPDTPETEAERRDVHAAARAIGLQLIALDVRSVRDIETALATLVQRGAGALHVGTGPFFASNRERIVALATRHALPASYPLREYALAGGLMSYGSSITDAYRQAGIYVGRILKGEKPGDLPVMRSTKFELVINLKTAKALGLEFHPQLLATADEVIE
jgi:putative ABC transport system substrate-binding protein